MILSAGLGTRLQPITEFIPKPLVPVLNIPNVVHSIDLLKRCGVTEIVMNLHHLAHDIRQYLDDGSRFGVSLRYTFEPDLLGTGGGVKTAAPFFNNEPFILVNCDFIIDIDLSAAIARHFERKALATMVVTEPLDGYTRVYFDKNRRLLSFEEGTETFGTFTGIHILSPECLHLLRPVYSSIITDLYMKSITRHFGSVYCDEAPRGAWHDTGDCRSLYHSTIALLAKISHSPTIRSSISRHLDYHEIIPGIWIPSDKKLPGTITIKAPAIIGSPDQLCADTEVGPYAVLSPQTWSRKPCAMSNILTIGSNQMAHGTLSGFFFNGNDLLK